jgi:membrane-bound ClpP family serine protease
MGGESPGRPGRLWLLLTGLLLVIMPAVTLAVAFVALSATQSVVVERITLVEAVELYLVELVAFGTFSYLLYRLTMYTMAREAAAAERRASLETADDEGLQPE